MHVIELFDRGAELRPEAACFSSRDGSRIRSYAEVEALSHRVAAGLWAAGHEPGQRAAVLSPNDAVAFTCVLGILRGGLAWLALNLRSGAEELSMLMREADCRALFYPSSLAEQAERLIADATCVTTAVILDDGEGRPGDRRLTELAAPEGTRVPLPADDREAPALYAGTGGTTGAPKIPVIPHRALIAQTLALACHMPDPEPVQIAAAPMTHAAGALTFPVMLKGGTTVIHEAVVPSQILDSIERHRATRIFLPPTAIYALLDEPGVEQRDYSSLRNFIYGAAPMSVDKLERAIDVFGPVMTQVYGQTEAATICAFLSPEEHAEAIADPRRRGRLASCGRPSVVTSLRIADEHGEALPPGERGEICVRTDLRMSGYLGDPESTEAIDRGQGWQATGDVGYRDEDGYVYIVDRTRDLIITGGFNVFPSEVERVLWAHPDVRDCAVIGVPDEKWGEAVTAVVEPAEGSDPDPEELVAICRERLGPVKAPKRVEIRQLPRSPVGKVLKRELRDSYWAERERAV